MRYCSNCGAEINENADVCLNCGCSVRRKSDSNDGLIIVIKIFLIIGCIASGWAIIPLAWLIPITVSIFGRLDRGEPVGTGLKVASLLLVNLVAGICLLVMDD